MPKPVDLPGVEVLAPITENHAGILSPEAIDFIVDLQRTFNVRRKEMLNARAERQRRLDAGERPKFLQETRSIRKSEWTVAPMPADLIDRRVEITGPVDRKMIINALNSGAKIFMADFEDSSTPTWNNLLDGHINLRDAVARTITYADPTTGNQYKVNEKVAVLFVRPHGWRLEERHVLVDGEPMSGSLFDFGLYFFHNAQRLVARGSGPYFYLPKMESHLDAQLWNDVFIRAQKEIGLQQGPFEGPC
jgi:malate synthase